MELLLELSRRIPSPLLLQTVLPVMLFLRESRMKMPSSLLQTVLPEMIFLSDITLRYIKYNFCLFKTQIYTDLHGFTGYKL